MTIQEAQNAQSRLTRLKNWMGHLDDWLLAYLIKLANRIYIIFPLYVVLVATAGWLYHTFEEGKTWWDGVWWAFITSLSIGYGDQFPVTVPGRMTAIVLGIIGILVIAPMIVGLFIKEVLLDLHQFTDCEQKLILKWLKLLVKKQLVISSNQLVIVHNQKKLAEMLIAQKERPQSLKMLAEELLSATNGESTAAIEAEAEALEAKVTQEHAEQAELAS